MIISRMTQDYLEVLSFCCCFFFNDSGFIATADDAIQLFFIICLLFRDESTWWNVSKSAAALRQQSQWWQTVISDTFFCSSDEISCHLWLCKVSAESLWLLLRDGWRSQSPAGWQMGKSERKWPEFILFITPSDSDFSLMTNDAVFYLR